MCSSQVPLKVYKVRGEMRRVLDWQPFTKFVLAHSEHDARERIFSLMGSKHRLRRHQIKVESVSLITDREEVDDAVVRQYMAQSG